MRLSPFCVLVITCLPSPVSAGLVHVGVGGSDSRGLGPWLSIIDAEGALVQPVVGGGFAEDPFSASITGVRTTGSTAYADASGGFEVRGGDESGALGPEVPKLIPVAHLYTRWEGYEGFAFASVEANATITDTVHAKLEHTVGNGVIKIGGISFDVFDEGRLYVPQTILNDALPVTAKYARDFSVRNFTFGVTVVDGNQFGSSYFEQSISDNWSGPQNVPIANQNEIVYAFPITINLPFPPVIVDEQDDLFSIGIQLHARTVADKYFWRIPLGPVIADAHNSSGVSGIHIYDSDGAEITSLFRFTNDAGDQIFSAASVPAVPEPATISLVSVGAFCFGIGVVRRRRVAL